jgi:hypothetical protein
VTVVDDLIGVSPTTDGNDLSSPDTTEVTTSPGEGHSHEGPDVTVPPTTSPSPDRTSTTSPSDAGGNKGDPKDSTKPGDGHHGGPPVGASPVGNSSGHRHAGQGG